MPLEPTPLDNRTFAQLFEEAKARIPVYTPEWTNFNESDPGITLVRLFAFMTENLLYRSNRIPEANQRKFLSLLGIGLQPASAARGFVNFINDRGPLRALPLTAGQMVRANTVPFRTRTPVCILPVTAVAFYKQPTSTLDTATQQQYRLLFSAFVENPTDQLTFYHSQQLPEPAIGKPLPSVDLDNQVNGTIDRSLWVALVGPPNASISDVRAAIAGQTLTLGIFPTPKNTEQVLLPAVFQYGTSATDPGLIFEIAAPDPNALSSSNATPAARYVRLTLDYADNVLEQPGIVQFRLPDYQQLVLWEYAPTEEGTGDYPPLVEDKALAQRIATWIRIRLPEPQDLPQTNTSLQSQLIQMQAHLTWVGTNAAQVIQAVQVNQESLGVGTGTPDQLLKVANTPVIMEPDSTNSPVILEVQDVNNNWQTWTLTDDLYAASPNTQVYTLDPESGQISFGSGLHGKRPLAGKSIRISYQYGGGPNGQVAIGAINTCSILPGGFKVTNALPTWGAQAGETVAEGERTISRYLRHRDRLVTVDDFRDITLRTPGLTMGRVEVLPLFNPDCFDSNAPNQTWPGTLTVMVIPQFDQDQPDAPVPDRLFLRAVCDWLNPRRLVTTEVYVRGPQYVPIWLSVGIVTMAGQLREVVQGNVRSALLTYLSPLIGGLPTTATAVGTGWPLGTEVRQQDLEAIATRVAGVRYVDSIKLGIVSNTSTIPQQVERVALRGLQLPRLLGISVREGTAESLQALFPAFSPVSHLIPVPVLPQKC